MELCRAFEIICVMFSMTIMVVAYLKHNLIKAEKTAEFSKTFWNPLSCADISSSSNPSKVRCSERYDLFRSTLSEKRNPTGCEWPQNVLLLVYVSFGTWTRDPFFLFSRRVLDCTCMCSVLDYIAGFILTSFHNRRAQSLAIMPGLQCAEL